MDKLLQSIKEGPLNPSSNDESSAVVNETSDEMNALLSKIIDKTENSDIQNNDNVGGDNDNNNLAVVNRTSETMNALLSKITDKTENDIEEMKDDEGGDNNKILINNNNNDDDDSDFYFDYEEDEDDELPPPPNESDGEDLDPDEINKELNNGSVNATINPDDEHTAKALQGDNFATESTVKKGEELWMNERPTFDKTAMREFEDQRKQDDPKGWDRKHGKDKKAQSRLGVVAKFGYLDEDDEEFKMDGDEVLFASLNKEKISLILRLRRALYNCGIEKEKWNNYQWQFDLKPNPNGTNEGVRSGRLVLCLECDKTFNALGGGNGGAVWAKLIRDHMRKCGDGKCNCGCGYDEDELRKIVGRFVAWQHFQKQMTKKDYTSMTEEIYYGEGGKEKLEVDEMNGKIKGGRWGNEKAKNGGMNCFEDIYWPKGETHKGAWRGWLKNISEGSPLVSRDQFDRLTKMKVPLSNAGIFDEKQCDIDKTEE